MHKGHPTIRIAAAAVLTFLAAGPATAAKPDGQLELKVVDADTDAPLPARIHLRDPRRRPVRTRGLGRAAHADHFYLDGSIMLGLRRGQYTFDLDAGNNRRTVAGDFEIQRRAEDEKTIELASFANLTSENWYAADVDAARPLFDLGLVLRAEQLAYAPLTAWQAGNKGWQQVTKTPAKAGALPPGAGLHVARVSTTEGDLLLVGVDQAIQPDNLPSADEWNVSAMLRARDAGYQIIAPDISAWRLPLWLAADVLDAVGVIDRTSGFKGVDEKASIGRARDRRRFPGASGVGRWREAIYFHALNAGLRLPAVAGSGSGVSESASGDSPLGANRTYAYCPDGFSVQSWWRATLAGETVVTSGPLLRPQVYSKPPGYVFQLDASGRFEAPIALNLSTRQTVEYLELIQDGEVAASVALRDWAAAGGRLPVLEFDAAGWFTVRAVTTNQDRYQLALSGPYYVQPAAEGDATPARRISRLSCQFFLDWLDDYAAKFANADQDDLAAARKFWQSRLNLANAP